MTAPSTAATSEVWTPVAGAAFCVTCAGRDVVGAGDAVIVGHNVRSDLGYLNGAMARTGRPKLANRVVDTLGLARRLVRDEVRDCRLSTLSRHFRLPNQPCHRAHDDALATAADVAALGQLLLGGGGIKCCTLELRGASS